MKICINIYIFIYHGGVMGLIRKISTINTRKVISVPHDWLKYYKKKGYEVNEVDIEVSDQLLITPILNKNEGEGN